MATVLANINADFWSCDRISYAASFKVALALLWHEASISCWACSWSKLNGFLAQFPKWIRKTIVQSQSLSKVKLEVCIEVCCSYFV